MITGAQLRQARELLGWKASDFAKRAKVSLAAVLRAEASSGEPMVTIAQASAMVDTLCAAGIEFTVGAEPSVKLKPKEQP